MGLGPPHSGGARPNKRHLRPTLRPARPLPSALLPVPAGGQGHIYCQDIWLQRGPFFLGDELEGAGSVCVYMCMYMYVCDMFVCVYAWADGTYVFVCVYTRLYFYIPTHLHNLLT